MISLGDRCSARRTRFGRVAALSGIQLIVSVPAVFVWLVWLCAAYFTLEPVAAGSMRHRAGQIPGRVLWPGLAFQGGASVLRDLWNASERPGPALASSGGGGQPPRWLWPWWWRLTIAMVPVMLATAIVAGENELSDEAILSIAAASDLLWLVVAVLCRRFMNTVEQRLRRFDSELPSARVGRDRRTPRDQIKHLRPTSSSQGPRTTRLRYGRSRMRSPRPASRVVPPRTAAGRPRPPSMPWNAAARSCWCCRPRPAARRTWFASSSAPRDAPSRSSPTPSKTSSRRPPSSTSGAPSPRSRRGRRPGLSDRGSRSSRRATRRSGSPRPRSSPGFRSRFSRALYVESRHLLLGVGAALTFFAVLDLAALVRDSRLVFETALGWRTAVTAAEAQEFGPTVVGPAGTLWTVMVGSFLVLQRARQNLVAQFAQGIRTGAREIVWRTFVPLANGVWLPRMAHDLWQAAAPEAHTPPEPWPLARYWRVTLLAGFALSGVRDIVYRSFPDSAVPFAAASVAIEVTCLALSGVTYLVLASIDRRVRARRQGDRRRAPENEVVAAPTIASQVLLIHEPEDALAAAWRTSWLNVAAGAGRVRKSRRLARLPRSTPCWSSSRGRVTSPARPRHRAVGARIARQRAAVRHRDPP